MYQYSVIIADDEIANVRGISRLLQQACPQVRITGTYDNGQSVIEHLQREPVDIAILDIKMPEVTGMETANWIYTHGLSTSVILMTGYREFEYAKQAVNVGVEAFWEKPLNLKDAVAKIHAICSRKDREAGEQIRLSHNIVLQNEKLNQDLKLFYFGIYDFTMLREKYPDADMLKGSCAIVEFTLAAEESRDEQYYKGIAQMESAQLSSFLLSADESSAKFLVLVPGENRLPVTRYAEETKRLLAFPAGDGCTYTVEWFAGLQALERQKQRDMAVLLLDELLFTKQKQSDILHIIGAYSPHLFKQFVALFLERAAEKTNIDTEKYRARAAGIKNKTELVALIDEIETELLQPAAEDNGDIEKIEQYIRSNCERDISLHEVAQKFSFNYSYLSRLFKKTTRMNFSDYLVYLRIEKAKEYLLSGRYKIDEIAQMVGYNKASYFRELFKKQTGMTPAQYIMLKQIAKKDV